MKQTFTPINQNDHKIEYSNTKKIFTTQKRSNRTENIEKYTQENKRAYMAAVCARLRPTSHYGVSTRDSCAPLNRAPCLPPDPPFDGLRPRPAQGPPAERAPGACAPRQSVLRATLTHTRAPFSHTCTVDVARVCGRRSFVSLCNVGFFEFAVFYSMKLYPFDVFGCDSNSRV